MRSFATPTAASLPVSPTRTGQTVRDTSGKIIGHIKVTASGKIIGDENGRIIESNISEPNKYGLGVILLCRITA
jgi:hypothetical protein